MLNLAASTSWQTYVTSVVMNVLLNSALLKLGSTF